MIPCRAKPPNVVGGSVERFGIEVDNKTLFGMQWVAEMALSMW